MNAERVLIVDDDPALRRVVGKLLQTAGYTTDEVGEADAALKRLANSVYDAVVSDVVLPGMRGTELLHAVRKAGNSIPFILMTGEPDLDTAVQAVNEGAFRFILKPFHGPELIDAVRKAVQAARSRDNPQAESDNPLGVRLDAALARLWMAYQPIYSVERHQVMAYEALVRTEEPSVPGPGVLFDLAERLGRVCDVGRTVRATAPSTFTSAPAQALLFVNLHAAELADETLYDPDSPLARISSRVVLELTERASLGDLQEVRKQVDRLRAIGFRIALDDLGAGYAGLTSLAALEPEVVKLDMSLVRNIHSSRVQRRLVEAMVAVARPARIRVVAEGIETPEERDTLLGLGCDWMQGYLFGRPSRQPQPVGAAAAAVAAA